MLWCRRCETPISESHAELTEEREVHSELDHERIHLIRYHACPYCGEVLEDADVCICGNWKRGGSELCPQCAQEVRSKYQNFLATIANNRKVPETQALKILDAAYDEGLIEDVEEEIKSVYERNAYKSKHRPTDSQCER